MNKTIIKIVLVSLLGMVLISCESSCDETIEVYDALTGEFIEWQCVTYNNN
jgi:hypothetical protein